MKGRSTLCSFLFMKVILQILKLNYIFLSFKYTTVCCAIAKMWSNSLHFVLSQKIILCNHFFPIIFLENHQKVLELFLILKTDRYLKSLKILNGQSDQLVISIIYKILIFLLTTQCTLYNVYMYMYIRNSYNINLHDFHLTLKEGAFEVKLKKAKCVKLE
jgi:hypothetical protein